MKKKPIPQYSRQDGLTFYMNPFWKLVAIVFFLCVVAVVVTYVIAPPKEFIDYLFLVLLVVVAIAVLYVSLVQMTVLVRLLPDGVHLSWFGREFRVIPLSRIDRVYIESRDSSGRNPFVLLAAGEISRTKRFKAARWGVYHGPVSRDFYTEKAVLWIFPLFLKYLPAIKAFCEDCNLPIYENSQM